MKQIVLFGLMLLSAISAAGQTQNVDSLENILNLRSLTKPEQLDLYEKISKFYVSNDMDKSIEYSKKGLMLAEKENNKSLAAVFNKYLGIVYHNKSDFDASRDYFEKSLAWAIEAKDKKAESAAYGSLGNLYKIQQNYQLAVEYYMKALSVCNEIEDGERLKANNLVNLGVVHRAIHNFERSIDFFEQALFIAEKLNLDDIKMSASHGLGTVYADKQEYGKSADYMLKTLELSRKLNNKDYETITLMSLATNFSANGNYDNALEYAKEGLRVAEEYGNPSRILGAQISLSGIYQNQGRYAESEAIVLKAWETDSTSLREGAFNALNIAIANIHLGNKEKAEHFVWKFQEIMVNGNNKSLHNSLADMEIKYETEKKEMHIASLEKERQLYVWLGISGVLLAIALVISLWQTKRNARKEKELVATRSVLDGEMRERTRLAQDLHDRLSGNLSAVKIELGSQTETLQHVRDKLDNCIRDIRDAAHNLMPTSLQSGIKVALEDYVAQFPNVKFHFFGEEKRIDRRLEFVVYCCAAELVNNAIKHSSANNINLQLVQDEKHVTLTVSDNGCGYDEKAAVKGFGLKSIRDRVASCNGKIDIVTSPNNGTETTIELKTDNA